MVILAIITGVSCGEDDPPAGQTVNHPPRFDALLLSDSLVVPGGSLDIDAVVSDPDGDPLEVTWSSSAGTFSSEQGVTTIWTAPPTVGMQTIVGAVSDGRETRAASDSVSVLVFGRLEVTSSPEGARIILDGTDTGLLTPALIAKADTGVHAVWIERDAEEIYLPAADTVSLGPGDTEKLSFRASLYRLTRHPADDVFPAFSPDGSIVAFASSRNGPLDLMQVSVAGGQPQSIFTSPGNQSYPSWSPGGSRLLFQDDRHCQNPDCWELWTYSFLDASVAKLSIPDTLAPQYPVWNPANENLITFQGENGIWSYDVASDSLSAITGDLFLDQHPQWTPSGEKILFSSTRPTGIGNRIFQSSLTGSPSLLVDLPGSDLLFPAMSSAGDKVSFQTIVSADPINIFSRDTAGGPPTPLTAKTGPNTNAVWSPVDDTVVFVSATGGNVDLWISTELSDILSGRTELLRIWRARGVAPEEIFRR